ncbi:MAG: hypothetical protein EOO06_06380 [Chitinophagaceae bacterium]|nr:MAG: hypothetical protein EOO06_06380 [Chitinophagaceae bacterium]
MNTSITAEELRKSQSLDSLQRTAKLLNLQLKEQPCLMLYELLQAGSAADDSSAAQPDYLPQDVILIPVRDFNHTDIYSLLLEGLQENQYRVPAVILPPLKWLDPNLEDKLQHTEGITASVTAFEGGRLWFPLTEITHTTLTGKTLSGQPKNCVVNIIPGTFIFDVSQQMEGLIDPADEKIEIIINDNFIKFRIYDGSQLGSPKYFKTLNEK